MGTHNPRPFLSGVRLVLLVGFLGLLGLLAFAGLYALHSLKHVAELEDQSTRHFVGRSDEPESIRSHAYAATSRVRDYLLDRETSAPALHRKQAVEAWDGAMASMERYQASGPFLSASCAAATAEVPARQLADGNSGAGVERHATRPAGL